MIKKIASLAFFTALSCVVAAQSTENTKKTGRPDIPGAFVLELGVNRGLNAPSNFDLGLWGSRTVNAYYQYELRILKSNFSLVPAIGLSMERYKFRNLRTLGYDEDSLKLVLPSELGVEKMKKSQLITNYIDLPVEIRYSANPDDPTRSFKASIGGRIGYMYDSFSKIKYKDSGEQKRVKDKQDFNVNKFRYGVFAKVGAGNFSVFGYYNLTNLFEDGKGPGEKNVVTDFPTFTIGISLASF